MSDAIVQTGRLLSLTTPLGADVLIPVDMRGEEGLSRLFRFVIEAVSTEEAVDPADILGKSVTLSIARKDRDPRCINGIVRSFESLGKVARGWRGYRLELVPTLWFLTRTSDCRIFQEKTVVEIAEALLGDGGVTDFKKQGLSGTHNAREYCVQYRETDFAFLSRLLEEEGIYYYFAHESGKHTLVLSDSASGYAACMDAECEHAGAVQGGAEVIERWAPTVNFQSGKWVLDDYNFEAPSTELQANTATVLDNALFKKWERYDYPGNYKVKGDGTTFSRLLMEADEATYAVVTGEGSYRGFAPGLTFTLSKHEVASEAGKAYVLTGVEHAAKDYSHLGNQGGVPTYGNRFTAIPSATVFRPQRTTPRPIVHGLQTAVVTGPSGEEIYCDKYGRIKVQFHWDRLGKKDETTTCYIRVAQILAGRNWGSIFTPRVGMEVLVDFLEGDPDRPLVVGSLYNGDNMPPYTLPDNKTQSGLKTRSSKQGDTASFNELRFEDKKDAEEIYFHAQKDFKRMVENDDTLTVDHDQTITIKNNRTETISEGNEKVTVSKGNRTVTITEGNETLTVSKGNRTVEVTKGNESVTVGQGNRTVEVGQGNDTLTVKMGNETVDVKQGNYSLKLGLGNATIKADAGKVSIEAMSGIELKVGSNSVKIDMSGITIKGTLVTVQGDGQVQVKSPMTQVSGDGMLTLKGGIVTIN